MIPEVTPAQLAVELATDHPPVLVDVREDYELDISKLEGVKHIPMNQLPERMNELDRDGDIVIVCRSGARSGRATMFLLGQGFRSVRNLATGMNGWAATVDPQVRAY